MQRHISAEMPRISQRVLAHSTSNTATRCSSTGHVPAFSDVPARRQLDSPECSRCREFRRFLQRPRFLVVAQRIRERFSFGQIAVKRVGLCATDFGVSVHPES